MSAVHFANHQEECSFSIKETQTAEAVPMTILDFEVHFFPTFRFGKFLAPNDHAELRQTSHIFSFNTTPKTALTSTGTLVQSLAGISPSKISIQL